MKQLLPLLLALLLCSPAANAKDSDNNRWQAVRADDEGTAVWILDTRTGKVKRCLISGVSGQGKPDCTPLSD
ncbi:hypothetical protein DV711_08375 [Motiliproteus coralliicola]|uniref:Uncharacterized protein n=1 Tax=Motiliproteus coralliicola TaxID=2283196 RepID=A0A369WN01_9GAMM|nr:hypothetical protein [Motiliproteus coralliicola]RDE22593.1 hypothetical protein DV711_08375 [Motiliproteus coralliicola]